MPDRPRRRLESREKTAELRHQVSKIKDKSAAIVGFAHFMP
jgi:hypothetical protein